MTRHPCDRGRKFTIHLYRRYSFQRHGPPFAKRPAGKHRRTARRFAIAAKQENLRV